MIPILCKKYIIYTSFPEEEIRKRINKALGENEFFNNKNEHVIIEGVVSEKTFWLKRKLKFKTLFYPVTSGTIISLENKECLIKVTVRVNKVYSVVYLFWLIFFSTISLYFFIIMVIELFNKSFSIWLLYPLLILFVGRYLVRLVFKKEFEFTKSFLLKLLNGKISFDQDSL